MLANLTQKTVAKDILLKKNHFLVNKGYKKTVMRKTNKRNNKAGTYTFDIKKKGKFIYLYMVPLPQSQISCHKFYNNMFLACTT